MRAHYGFNLCGTLETQSWFSFSSSSNCVVKRAIGYIRVISLQNELGLVPAGLCVISSLCQAR